MSRPRAARSPSVRGMSTSSLCLLLCALLNLSGAGAAPPAAPSPPPFPAPGESIEVLVPGQPLPFVPLLPGMQVESWRVEAGSIEVLQTPWPAERLGPPLLRLDYVYAGKPGPGARSVLNTYRSALTQAGWKVDVIPRVPAGAFAQYTQNGRSLRLKLHADRRALHLTLWEPAAHVRPELLRSELASKGSVVVYGIAFEINKDRLRREAVPVLRQILTLLRETPDLKLEIQVHSDDSSRNVYGRRPTHNRAHEIMRWLISQGVDPARLTAQGYGETKPLVLNRTPEDRARNRRVELVKRP
jgi:outer membrane protein OmpA-like peptidoglycan-associated protein